MSELAFIAATLGLKVGALIVLGMLLARGLAPGQRLVFLRALLLAVPSIPLFTWALPPLLLPLLPPGGPPLAASPSLTAVPAAVSAADWTLWLAAIYLAGVLLLAVRFVRQFIGLRRWARAARSLTTAEAAGLPAWAADGRQIRIGWCEQVSSPVSFGWPRSEVLLPVAWRGEPGERVSHALAHELAHVERRDWLWLVVIRLVQALVWWNPLIYPLLRALDEETELACDRRALARVRSPAGYARSLLSLAGEPTLAAVPMSGSRYWRRRLQLVLHYRSEELPMTRIPTVLAVTIAAAVAVPLAACQIVSAGEAPPPSTIEAAAPAVEAPSAPLAERAEAPPLAPAASKAALPAPASGPPAAEAYPAIAPRSRDELTPPARPAPVLAPTPARAARLEIAGIKRPRPSAQERDQRRANEELRRAELQAQRAELQGARAAMAAELEAERSRIHSERGLLARDRQQLARDSEAARAELEAVRRELDATRQELERAREEAARREL